MEAETKYNPSAGSFLIALERQLKTSLRIPMPNGEMREIALLGKADRIDRHEGVTRIIDYKTGKVAPKDLDVKEVETLFNPPPKKITNDKAFQLMFYLLLAERSGEIETAGTPLSAGIVTFRSLKNGFIPLNLTDTSTSTALHFFEEGLKNLFTEMFDETIPFTQTENQDNCRYCPYKAICSIHTD
jgi:ATP-dependent helicase/DNAse subunit B